MPTPAWHIQKPALNLPPPPPSPLRSQLPFSRQYQDDDLNEAASVRLPAPTTVTKLRVDVGWKFWGSTPEDEIENTSVEFDIKFYDAMGEEVQSAGTNEREAQGVTVGRPEPEEEEGEEEAEPEEEEEEEEEKEEGEEGEVRPRRGSAGLGWVDTTCMHQVECLSGLVVSRSAWYKPLACCVCVCVLACPCSCPGPGPTMPCVPSNGVCPVFLGQTHLPSTPTPAHLRLEPACATPTIHSRWCPLPCAGGRGG